MEYNFIAELVLLNSMLISYPCLTFICKYSSYVGIFGGDFEKTVRVRNTSLVILQWETSSYLIIKYGFAFFPGYIHSTMTAWVSYVLVGKAIFRLVITETSAFRWSDHRTPPISIVFCSAQALVHLSLFRPKKLHTLRTIFRVFAPFLAKNLISNVSVAWLMRH